MNLLKKINQKLFPSLNKQYIACDGIHINSGIANGLKIFQSTKTIDT